MKFKIEIDIEDLQIEEGEILAELKHQIKMDAVNQIRKLISEQTTKALNESVKAEVSELVGKIVEEEKDKFLGIGEVTLYNETIQIREHLKKLFEQNSGWNTPTEQIKKLATLFGNQMKERLDFQFATAVVSRMAEQGYMKEDVVKNLLNPSKKEAQ